TLLDTSDESSLSAFRQSHQNLLTQIGLLHKGVSENIPLKEKIIRKFKMKNTTGYSLNALVDYSDPIDILQHLMIGSEGTLGFIAEIRYKTVVEHPFKASSLIFFPDIHQACRAVTLLKQSPVSAVELIDRAGLRSVETEKGLPVDLTQLADGVSALLIETRASSHEQLIIQSDTIIRTLSDLSTLFPVRFTEDPQACDHLWKIRKGLFPSVGAMRKKGTTVIIEDVSFPVERLAEATLDLQELFAKWGYHEAVIFGHALMGNLHFVFTQDFQTSTEVDRYRQLMEDVTRLVVEKYDGALKAEHGTGRNMAPFVGMEWGADAYLLMQRIKQIFDPDHLLNPGVILNTDPVAHLKNLKPMPAAHEKVDACIECGFCEPNCVSADLTLSPRQRIVVYRQMEALRKSGSEPHLLAQLNNRFRYAGNETCATDGLCAAACPVKIDTGKLIKILRRENIGKGQKNGLRVAARMALVTKIVRNLLGMVAFFHRLLGTRIMKGITSLFHRITLRKLPLWNEWMPTGAKKIALRDQELPESDRIIVYFPSCINRSMGGAAPYKEQQLTTVMEKLLRKGGYQIRYPENLDSLCCGMAFSSKGYAEAGALKSAELEAALLKASDNGRHPILCDMSPCLFTMRENMGDRLKLHEPVEFILDHLLPHLAITPAKRTVAVFPVCSMKKMGLEDRLTELASHCVSNVVVAKTNCCGFAGDRGFTYPELNRHGLRMLKEQLPQEISAGYSTSRTCEIGLSLHSGINFQSIVYLVDEVSASAGSAS
ncbi:MAG: 4Fe-4S dicluster domain-containing protein, partial [Marinilabiliales bacterium]|nr:4Fe-4S dicluster domain-containing protein [Marinilabiliales bacterium]